MVSLLFGANHKCGSPPPPGVSLVSVLLAFMEAAKTELGLSQWELYSPELEPWGCRRYRGSIIHTQLQLP